MGLPAGVWGGRGSNPRPTDYESLDTGRATRRNSSLQTHQIACKTTNLAVAGTVPVRLRYGYESPPVAGVTPG